MINYIVFDTKSKAVEANKLCWVKFLKDNVSVDSPAVNGQEYTDLSDLSDDEISLLKLCGSKKCGTIQEDKGVTTTFQLYPKAYSLEKWFSAEPPAEYLALLSGYETLTLQQIIDDGYYPPD